MRLTSGGGVRASSSNELTCRRCVDTRRDHNHYHDHRHRARARRRRRRRPIGDSARWSSSLGRKGGANDAASGCCFGSSGSAGRVVLAAVVHSHGLVVDAQQVRCATRCCDKTRTTSDDPCKLSADCQSSSSSSRGGTSVDAEAVPLQTTTGASKQVSSSSSEPRERERKANKLSRFFSRNKRKLSSNDKEQTQATELIDKPHCNEYANEQSTLNSATTTTTNKRRADLPIELSERCPTAAAATTTTTRTTTDEANLSERVRDGNYLRRRDEVDRQQTSSGESCGGGGAVRGNSYRSDTGKTQVIEFKFDLIVDAELAEDESDNVGGGGGGDLTRGVASRRENGRETSARSTGARRPPVERADAVDGRGQSERKLTDNVNELIEAFVLDSSDVCLMTTGKRQPNDSNRCGGGGGGGGDVCGSAGLANAPLCELLEPIQAAAKTQPNRQTATQTASDTNRADEFEQINQLAAKSVAYAFELLQSSDGRQSSESAESSGVCPTTAATTTTTTTTTTSSIEVGAILFLREPNTQTGKSLQVQHMNATLDTTHLFSIIDLVDGGEVCAENRNGSTVVECHSLEDALTCVQGLRNNLRHLQTELGSLESGSARSVGGGQRAAQATTSQKHRLAEPTTPGKKQQQQPPPKSSSSAQTPAGSCKKLLVINFKLKRRINGGLFSNRMCLIDFDPNFVELRCIFESIFDGQALAHLNRRKLHLQQLESELANRAAMWSSPAVSAGRRRCGRADKLVANAEACCSTSSSSSSSTCSSSSSSSSSAAAAAASLRLAHNSHLDLLEKQHHRVASLNKLVQAEWLLYKLLSSVLIRTLIIVHVHRLVVPMADTGHQPASAESIDTTIAVADDSTDSSDGSPASFTCPTSRRSHQRASAATTAKGRQGGRCKQTELAPSKTESWTRVSASESTSERVNYGDFDFGKSAQSQSQSQSQAELEWQQQQQQLSNNRSQLNRLQVEQRLMDINLDALEFARALQRASSSRLRRRKEHLKSHHLISPTSAACTTTATSNLSVEHLIKSNELVVHHSSTPIRVKHKRQRQVSGALATPMRRYKTPLKGAHRDIAPESFVVLDRSSCAADRDATLMQTRALLDSDLIRAPMDLIRVQKCAQAHSSVVQDNVVATPNAIHRAQHLLYSSSRSGNESSSSPSTVVGSSDGTPSNRCRVLRDRRDLSEDRLCYNASDRADSCSISGRSSGSQRDKRDKQQLIDNSQAIRRTRDYEDTTFIGYNAEQVRATASSRLFYAANSTNGGNYSDSDSIASTNLNSSSSASAKLRRKRLAGGLLGVFVNATASPSQTDDLDSVASGFLQSQLHPAMHEKAQAAQLRQPIELRALDACNRVRAPVLTSSSAMANNRNRCAGDNWMPAKPLAGSNNDNNNNNNNNNSGDINININLNQSTPSNQMISRGADTIEGAIQNKTIAATLVPQTYLQANYDETDSAMLDDNASDICSMVAEPPRQLKLEEFLSHLSSFIGPTNKAAATNASEKQGFASDSATKNNGSIAAEVLSNKDLNLDEAFPSDNSVIISQNNKISFGVDSNNSECATDRNGNIADEDIEDEDCKSHSSILERLCLLALESSSKVRLSGNGAQQVDCQREQVEQNPTTTSTKTQNESGASESSSSRPFGQVSARDDLNLQTGGHLKRILNSSHQLQKGLSMRNKSLCSQELEESIPSTEQRLKALIIECESAPTTQPRLNGSVASSSISSTESNCSSPLSSSAMDRVNATGGAILAASSGNNKCTGIVCNEQQVHKSDALCANVLRHHPKLRT